MKTEKFDDDCAAGCADEERRIEWLMEKEGLTRSDAQAVVEAEQIS